MTSSTEPCCRKPRYLPRPSSRPLAARAPSGADRPPLPAPRSTPSTRVDLLPEGGLSHDLGGRDDSQTTTSAGCLRQLPGPLRAADAGRGHRPTPTDRARAAQHCKLLVLGLPKRCCHHTVLVSKPLGCAVTRFLSLLLPATTPCDLKAQGEAPADPSVL